MTKTSNPGVPTALTAALLGVAVAVALALALPASPAWAATFTVTKIADTNDGSCDATDCSLREAIVAANASVENDEITVPAGTYRLTIAGAGEDAAATGDLDITGGLTITGAGARETVIDGAGIDRAFQIMLGRSVNISNVAVRNGDSGGDLGGGILSSGVLTVDGVALSGNTTDNGGGGIFSDGTLSVTDSTFSGNSSFTAGGGVFVQRTATITNSTFSDNRSSSNRGGGVIVSGSSSTLAVTNSTFDGNHASVSGGGISAFSGAATLENTIVSNNTAPSGHNCAALEGGTITSRGSNLEYPNNSCNLNQPGDKPNTKPELGPLQNNGGPTDTRALLPESPAIDAANAVGCPATDQRGGTRPADGDDNGSAVCDIGAFELAAAGVPPPPPDDGCTIRGTSGDDVLLGTSSHDNICGYGGNDQISAGAGFDNVMGGDGNDALVGGTGRDNLYGQAGNDRLNTRDGVRRNDLANGGTGTDTCAVDSRGNIKDRKVSCER